MHTLTTDAQIKAASITRKKFSCDMRLCVLQRITSPLVYRAFTWTQVVRLDFWWCGRYLLLPFNWTFVMFLETSTVCSPSTPVPSKAKAGRIREESIIILWLSLQWQMYIPSQFSSGEVKTGKVNALTCLFTSEIKPGMLKCTHMSLFLEIILEYK